MSAYGKFTAFALLLAVTTGAPAFAAGKPQMPPTAASASSYKAELLAQDTDWPMYNRVYAGDRYSELTQINADNADRLAEICRVRVGELSSFQTGPVLADGILYVTLPRATVAIDPASCDVIWKSIYTPEGPETWPVNRGLVFLDGRVFRGTSDARMLAYDAKTGRELWRTVAGKPEISEWIAAAPLAWNGKVFAGVSGADWGVAGHIGAYDAESGKEIWNFNLVPREGEPGYDSWDPDTPHRAGGATWTSYALDPEAGELFVPASNAAPDYLLEFRGGHELLNLYTNSLVVLDANTGKLKWYYQVSPHDDRDLDLAAPPMLYSLADGRKVVALGSKDGRVYVIDRRTHRLLWKTAVTTIWNEGVKPTREGTAGCPGTYGGVEWNGPARDVLNRRIVVGALDWCSVLVVTDEQPKFVPNQPFLGGYYYQIGPARGWLTSIDEKSGRIAWRHRFDAPTLSGVTPTAGGVVFAGDTRGNFHVFASEDGRVLYKAATGGNLAGGIITYALRQRQYVALATGSVARTDLGSLGPTIRPSVVIYSLNEQSFDAIRAEAGAGASGVAHVASLQPDAEHGRTLFATVCSGCHGSAGDGMGGTALTGIAKRQTLEQTLGAIMQPRGQMPLMYPSAMSDQDVADVAAHVRSLQ